VRRVDRDWGFTIDGAGSELGRASGDNSDEKAPTRAHAAVLFKKDKPRKAVHIVESTETSESHPDRNAGKREADTDLGGKMARHGLAIEPRKHAVDSGYRIRVETYNVAKLLRLSNCMLILMLTGNRDCCCYT
jgi:hypothetical protein